MNRNLVNIPVTRTLSVNPCDLRSVVGWLLLSAGAVLIPYLPRFVERILDMPDRMMANGYSCSVKKGDLEVDFGRDTPAEQSPMTEVEYED